MIIDIFIIVWVCRLEVDDEFVLYRTEYLIKE